MSGDALLLRINKGGQVRLPSSLVKVAGIKEGDFLEVRLEGELIVLTPGGHPEDGQSYFWTEAWQQAEREADEDIAEGRIVDADAVEGLADESDQGPL